MTQRLVLTMLMCLATGAAQASAAEEVVPQILMSLRLCQGDINKPETFHVLAQPTVVTLDGQTASVMVGQEHVGKSDDVRVISGTRCELKPTLRKDGRILVEVDYSHTRPVKTDDDSVRSVQGTCIRSAVLATPGKTIKLSGSGKGADAMWLELTTEILKAK